jgi:hypothetical protein
MCGPKCGVGSPAAISYMSCPALLFICGLHDICYALPVLFICRQLSHRVAGEEKERRSRAEEEEGMRD